nr:hypothetical protein [Tanacetum cinerariifolium]
TDWEGNILIAATCSFNERSWDLTTDAHGRSGEGGNGFGVVQVYGMVPWGRYTVCMFLAGNVVGRLLGQGVTLGVGQE